MSKPLLVWFKDVGKEDVGLVGGKGANLGEMTQAGFPVPPGFIVTSQAYFNYIKENGFAEKIHHVLKGLDINDSKKLNNASEEVKKIILHGKISDELVHQVFDAYKKLGGVLENALVAVRSSATAEDLPNASFAGQQETYLNVQGEANVIQAMKEAWASLFNARAIFYREEQHFDHFKVGIATPVQKMINGDASGVMFSINPVTNDKNTIVIESIYGLGEYIVQGTVNPDHYEVSKHDLTILNKHMSIQTVKLVKKGKENKEEKISAKEGSKQKITDHQIVELATLSKKLEKHYYFPQDSEWAIEKGHVYIVQTRAVTTVKAVSANTDKEQDELKLEHLHLQTLLKGDPASPGIGSGPVKILKSAKEIGKVQTGDVLVAPQTNPDFVPAMKKAVAIVTDFGGRTSHAAIVSREIGIPAIVGTKKATEILKEGEIVTVDGIKGEVYKGGFSTSKHSDRVEPRIQTATKVYTNLAEPEFADSVARRHVDGVGLLRAEFMMAGIGTHPKKFIKEKRSKEFIEKLADGMEKFCKPFSPRPVVYRASDFKTNEYRNLVGGKEFEPVEPNPMLGYRGAFRYINDPEVFNLELEAIKLVRNKRGYKNLWLMIPFVRTVNELIQVKQIVAASGLHRSPTFKFWMMVEIPSNVIILDKFIEVGIDGVSIGSNDLTMLMLGTDRDNDTVAKEFDERNAATMWAFERVIKTCHAHKITSSMCGQAPSQYPDLLEKLVEWGITSVSVTPDVIDTTREKISEIERKLLSK